MAMILFAIALLAIQWIWPKWAFSWLTGDIGFFLLFVFSLLVVVQHEVENIRVIEKTIGFQIIEHRRVKSAWKSVNEYQVLAANGRKYTVMVRRNEVISVSELR